MKGSGFLSKSLGSVGRRVHEFRDNYVDNDQIVNIAKQNFNEFEKSVQNSEKNDKMGKTYITSDLSTHERKAKYNYLHAKVDIHRSFMYGIEYVKHTNQMSNSGYTYDDKIDQNIIFAKEQLKQCAAKKGLHLTQIPVYGMLYDTVVTDYSKDSEIQVGDQVKFKAQGLVSTTRYNIGVVTLISGENCTVCYDRKTDHGKPRSDIVVHHKNELQIGMKDITYSLDMKGISNFNLINRSGERYGMEITGILRYYDVTYTLDNKSKTEYSVKTDDMQVLDKSTNSGDEYSQFKEAVHGGKVSVDTNVKILVKGKWVNGKIIKIYDPKYSVSYYQKQRIMPKNELQKYTTERVYKPELLKIMTEIQLILYKMCVWMDVIHGANTFMELYEKHVEFLEPDNNKIYKIKENVNNDPIAEFITEVLEQIESTPTTVNNESSGSYTSDTPIPPSYLKSDNVEEDLNGDENADSKGDENTTTNENTNTKGDADTDPPGASTIDPSKPSKFLEIFKKYIPEDKFNKFAVNIKYFDKNIDTYILNKGQPPTDNTMLDIQFTIYLIMVYFILSIELKRVYYSLSAFDETQFEEMARGQMIIYKSKTYQKVRKPFASFKNQLKRFGVAKGGKRKTRKNKRVVIRNRHNRRNRRLQKGGLGIFAAAMQFINKSPQHLKDKYFCLMYYENMFDMYKNNVFRDIVIQDDPKTRAGSAWRLMKDAVTFPYRIVKTNPVMGLLVVALTGMAWVATACLAIPPLAPMAAGFIVAKNIICIAMIPFIDNAEIWIRTDSDIQMFEKTFREQRSGRDLTDKETKELNDRKNAMRSYAQMIIKTFGVPIKYNYAKVTVSDNNAVTKQHDIDMSERINNAANNKNSSSSIYDPKHQMFQGGK